MKKRIIRIIVGTSLVALTLAAFAQLWVLAQTDTPRDLVGSWDVIVTPRDCETGNPAPFPPPFYGMQTYNLGGTMMESDPGNLSAPSTNVGGQGIWARSGGREYSVAFRYFRFNPDGTPAGKDVIRDVVLLDRGGNTYTSTGTIEIFDPAGNLVFTGCATTTATRFN
jgi:hypothetical protein